MRRIIYVAAVFFALGAMSCSKQNIQPNSNENASVPTWRSSDDGAGSGFIQDSDESITDPDKEGDGEK